MPILVRHVRDDEEFDTWVRASHRGFGELVIPDERVALERLLLPMDRMVTAFDGERIVGTAGDYPFEMTVPGGATLPVAGVTGVTVAPTHRRRGILRQMMATQLDEVVTREEPVAVLNASEAGIYGRFGYGLAQMYQRVTIARARNAFSSPVPERSLPMRMLSKAEARDELPAVYDRCRLRHPGMLSQPDDWWDAVLGDEQIWKGGGDLFAVIADEDGPKGTGPGFALYRIGHRTQPGTWPLTVFDIEAADPVVEAQLLRFLLDVDLVGSVTFEGRPLDCPLRWWLVDPRAVLVEMVADYLWVRLLDIESSMAARRYPVADDVTVEVHDPFRPGTSGCYLVEGGPDGASCERTQAPPHLAMDVADLGAIYLGQATPSALAAAGRVRELVPGTLERADRFFNWPVAPFCATRF